MGVGLAGAFGPLPQPCEDAFAIRASLRSAGTSFAALPRSWRRARASSLGILNPKL